MDFKQYDAGLGRFYGLDLLAEATPWATPNHFALNNPVMASDPTGLLATWSEIVQMMNDFATSDGNDSMTFTSNGGVGGGGSAWSFGVSYSDGSGNIFDGVTISGNGFIANSTIGTGMWQINQTVNVHLPEMNVRGLSTREGGRAIQQHVYKNSPYYQGSTSGQGNSSDVLNWFNNEKDTELFKNANNYSNIPSNVVVLNTHGLEGGKGIMLPDGTYTKNLKKFSGELYKESNLFKNFKDNGGKLTLVLKACQTGKDIDGGVAKSFSAMNKGLTVIGPTENIRIIGFLGLLIGQYGIINDGTYNVYYNNELIKRFND